MFTRVIDSHPEMVMPAPVSCQQAVRAPWVDLWESLAGAAL